MSSQNTENAVANPVQAEHRKLTRWKWGRTLVLAVFIVCAAIVSGMWYGQKIARKPYQSGGLYIPERALNFGQVWMQKDFNWVLPITNTTTESIEIESVKGSCECTAITPRSLTINPGETAELQLTLNFATKQIPQRRTVPSWDFSMHVLASVKGKGAQLPGWEVRGTIRNALKLASSTIHLDSSWIAGTPLSPKTVLVKSFEPLTGLHVQCDESVCRVTTEKVGDDRQFAVRICPNDALPIGPVAFPLFLKPMPHDEVDVPPIQLVVKGSIVGEMAAFPDKVVVGALPIGESVQETVVLRSRLGRTFEVLEVKTSSPAVTFVVEGSTKLPTSELQCTIHVKAKSARRAAIAGCLSCFSC